MTNRRQSDCLLLCGLEAATVVAVISILLENAELEHADQRDDDEQHPAGCGSDSVLSETELLVHVVRGGERRVERPSLGHHEGFLEELQVGDGKEHGSQQQRGLEQRKRDAAEDAPFARAVDGRGLLQLLGDGLQAIPEELKEAAAIDGAGKWRIFRSITLPLLKPTLLLGAVLLSVAYLQFFEESFVMTQGGPLDSTLSAAYYVYQKFGFGQYGIASAASWVLFIIIALVSVLQFRILKED